MQMDISNGNLDTTRLKIRFGKEQSSDSATSGVQYYIAPEALVFDSGVNKIVGMGTVFKQSNTE